MEGPGDYLKREREIRGISLEDVSQETKLSIKALKNLEGNNFGALPPYPFVKGFIRSYSKCIGIDGDDAVLRYDAYLREQEADARKGAKRRKGAGEGKAVPEASRGLTIFLDEEKRGGRGGRRGLHRYSQMKAIIPLAMILLLIIAAVVLFYPRSGPLPPGEDSTQPATEAKEDIPVKEETAVIPSPSPVDKTGDLPADDRELTLQMRAKKPTWMRVEIDDTPPFEVSLREGETISWKARNGFSLLIGNAGGVEGTFNGKPLGDLGEEGKVVRLNLVPPQDEGAR